MRRADRLLQIIQILRREKGPVAGTRMAEELEISLRTLYRDMVSLEASGVPVRGEAGVGYVLDDGFDMPPLMFTANELEAIMLGARMIDGRVDDALSQAARDAVAKIAAVVPSELRDSLINAPLFAPMYQRPTETTINMADVRRALRSEAQIRISYRDLNGNESERVIWPVLLSFFRNASVLVAWCTLREDFRSFRLDNMTTLELLPERSPKPRRTLFAQWRNRQMDQLESSRSADWKVEKIYGV
ncbi:MAG: YafY family protein [Pseudomonadota bacterium]